MSATSGTALLGPDNIPIAQAYDANTGLKTPLQGEDGAADARPIAHIRGAGWSKKYMAALSNAGTAIATGRRKLAGYHLYNSNTSDVFVQVFDQPSAADVTLGTTVPDAVYVVPGGGGILDAQPTLPGVVYTSGIVVAATSTAGGSATPGAALLASWFYV